MKRALGACALIIIVAVSVAILFRNEITVSLIEKNVARNISSSVLDELPDGLHLVLCGAGSPLTDPKRSGPCSAVIAGDRVFVVDTGANASRNLNRMRVPQGRVNAILLTHYHSDHIDGFGELVMQRWATGEFNEPVPVYGPDGVDQIVEGFAQAYAQDTRYRIAHHGEAVMPPESAGAVVRHFNSPLAGEEREILNDNGLRIIAFKVDHEPVVPAVGYRFDYKGRSLLISGDTAKSDNLEEFAQNVDLLVHEALAPQLVNNLTRGARAAQNEGIEKITMDILDYHATPVEAAEVARDANVSFLLYNHVIPPLLLPTMEAMFLDGVDDVYSGPVHVGQDGTLLSLPAGSKVIEVSELL